MGKMKRIFIPILVFAFFIANITFLEPTSVYAKKKDETSQEQSSDSLGNLIDLVSESDNTVPFWDYNAKTYKIKDGGYYVYSDLVTDDTTLVNEDKLASLTTGAKRDFLSDYYSAALKCVEYYEAQGTGNTKKINSETMNALMSILQTKSGVGSSLIASIMSQTKPDFVTANRIYSPFSGTVGTVLGIISILIIAFLAITMVLDIAYIAIPVFQLFVNGDGGGQGGEKKSFISYEAIQAVQQAQGGGGGSGQDGGLKKVAVFIYLKSRALMLFVLAICILYLVSGNIFSLIGYLIDLMSGFLGF